MEYLAAPRCRHIKVNGTQCGSPAQRHKSFCFYHQQNRPILVDCYYNPEEYATGEIALPVFEDAHSVQTVIRQIMQMVLQKRLEGKTAGLMLYALQIASSNLKRIELEKPQPEQVVTDVEQESGRRTLIAAVAPASEVQTSKDQACDVQTSESSTSAQPATPSGETIQAAYVMELKGQKQSVI
jgi:hypothetical protein